MYFRSFLTEMIVHGDRRTGSLLIAFRGHIWLFANSSDNAEEAFETIVDEHPDGEILTQRARESIVTADDLSQFVMENIPDSLTGWWDQKRSKLSLMQSGHSLHSSPLVRKVAEELNIKSITYSAITNPYGDDRDMTVKRKNMLAKLPRVFYHGTTVRYLESILKTGIRPNQMPSNYKSVNNPNLIFVSSNVDEAMGHAWNAASGANRSNSKSKSYPAIIATRLPDPDLLFPDRDVDMMADLTAYGGPGRPWRFSLADQLPDDKKNVFSVSSQKAGKFAGVWAYRGRIPPSNFIAVMLWDVESRGWKVVRNISALKNMLNNFGVEAIGNKYGDEFDKMEKDLYRNRYSN